MPLRWRWPRGRPPVAVVRAYPGTSVPFASVDRGLLTSLLAFVILMALVIGWTTPVMGAIVRYRTPALPFLLIAGLLVLDHRRLLTRWPGLKPILSA